MARGGAKKFPFYQVQVADRRAPRDGRYIERIGYYNPRVPADEGGLKLDLDRAQYWLDQGAVVSDRVRKLIAVQTRLLTAPAPESQDSKAAGKKAAAKAGTADKSKAKAPAAKDKSAAKPESKVPAAEASSGESSAEATTDKAAPASAAEASSGESPAEAATDKAAQASTAEASSGESSAEAAADKATQASAEETPAGDDAAASEAEKQSGVDGKAPAAD